MTITDRAALYIERMEPSIQGSQGSTALFNVALALVKGFNLAHDEAWPLILRWNQTHCQPPWSEPELRHKLGSAAKSARLPGYLINEQEPRPRAAPGFESENERKARQRRDWSAFRALSLASLQAIASLRNLPLQAVKDAAAFGFLHGAVVEGHRCFIIHEGNFAQARRFDGQPFTLADGRTTKAKNLPGSQGAFIGQRLLGSAYAGHPAPKVLLIEGCIALVEAIAAHAIADPRDGWTVLAATSASARFARDPELLAALPGRFVRIIPDADEAGYEAAASWLTDLENAGCQVDAHPLPDGIKDLGPLVADPATHAQTLTAIFTP